MKIEIYGVREFFDSRQIEEPMMFRHKRKKSAAQVMFLVFLLSPIWVQVSTYGHTDDSPQSLNQRINELLKVQQFTQALPLLEKLVVVTPNDPEAHFHLGFSLLAQANITKGAAERKALRIRARSAFAKAKELGTKELIVDALLQSIPADGSEGKAFSQNVEANGLMEQAEAFFSQGKLDDALTNYQKALQLDPGLYEAALFSGDVYSQKGEFDKAEAAYQKAISIDPNREIAYRYSATPLMKQQKYDQARDRYVEAYISEPYSRFAATGLAQWAQVTKATLGHPKIDIPTSVTFDEKGDARINWDASVLAGGKEDGSFAWVSYGATRSTWRKEKFAKTFPAEKAYRHSLPEEVEALRDVISLATSGKNIKTLSPSLAKLKKLNDEGLLEAYILIARADAGIAVDYPDYREQNRNKLRRYVVEYVLTGGGT
jgi:tetratricopeptide (TPR) repeat protein